jgi:predicted transposase YdaD
MTTTLKEKILEELNQMPEEALEEILAYVQSLKFSTESPQESAIWQSYQKSKQERAEVYRRLANS